MLKHLKLKIKKKIKNNKLMFFRINDEKTMSKMQNHLD